MQYLIIPKDGKPFYTFLFDPVNHFEGGMIVVDLLAGTIYNGQTWEEIEQDHF